MSLVDALAWFCSSIALAGLAVETFNLSDFRALRPRSGANATVVACVAMRNEARNARECVSTLLAQREIGAVVVCDDGSTDGTADLLAEIAREDDRVLIVRTPANAPGPSPKARALAAAAHRAKQFSHTHLFFTDADVSLNAGAVGALLGAAQEYGAQAASGWPRVRAVSLWDALLAPIVVLFVLQALPLRAVRAGNARFAAGNGQIFLVERSAYAASGGHGEVRGYVEDVELARRLRASGSGIVLVNASRIAAVNGYGSAAANVGGYGRSLYFGAGPAGAIVFAIWQLGAFVLPWALFPASPHAALAGICASVAARAIVARSMGGSSLQVLQTPLGGLLGAYTAAAAFARGVRGAFVWRGRRMMLEDAA